MSIQGLKFCPDLTQVVWEKAMMVGHGDYQRIQLNECIKERCVAYCKEDGKCHKYMNDVNWIKSAFRRRTWIDMN